MTDERKPLPHWLCGSDSEQHSTHSDDTRQGIKGETLPDWLLPSVGSVAADYIREADLALIPVPLGAKGPISKGWNREAFAIRSVFEAAKLVGCNIGLSHLWCATCALDIDDMTLAEPWLAARGVNVQALLAAPDACLISSGRPNRIKAIYRLPRGVPWLPTINPTGSGLELRQSAKEGTRTVHDLLPPSIHPDTGKPYVWAGTGHWSRLAALPTELLAIWRSKKLCGPRISPARQAKPRLRAEGGGWTNDEWRRLQEILRSSPGIPADHRDVWIKVGMALHSTGHPEAYELWVEWSQTTTRDNFDLDACEMAWRSFRCAS